MTGKLGAVGGECDQRVCGFGCSLARSTSRRATRRERALQGPRGEPDAQVGLRGGPAERGAAAAASAELEAASRRVDRGDEGGGAGAVDGEVEGEGGEEAPQVVRLGVFDRERDEGEAGGGGFGRVG